MLAGIMEDKRSNSVVRKRKKATYIVGGTYVLPVEHMNLCRMTLPTK
jgi:hypothetical protein